MPRQRPQTWPELFQHHPLPWWIGECHESKATILDAHHEEVMTLNNLGPFGPFYAPDLAELLIQAVQAQAQISQEPIKES